MDIKSRAWAFLKQFESLPIRSKSRAMKLLRLLTSREIHRLRKAQRKYDFYKNHKSIPSNYGKCSVCEAQALPEDLYRDEELEEFASGPIFERQPLLLCVDCKAQEEVRVVMKTSREDFPLLINTKFEIPEVNELVEILMHGL